MERQWDKVMGEYDKYEAFTEWALGYSTVDELLGDVKGKEVLDYGCGTGKYARHLQQKGAVVRAVDSSLVVYDVAARRHIGKGSYHFIEDPKQPNLGLFPDGLFDAAVANFIFCCIPERETLTAIAQVVHRKIKPEAPFVICDNHPWSTGGNFVSFARKSLERKVSGAPIQTFFRGPNLTVTDYWRSLEEYTDILTDAGFTITALKEPMARDEKKPWHDELRMPPFVVIEAVKK